MKAAEMKISPATASGLPQEPSPGDGVPARAETVPAAATSGTLGQVCSSCGALLPAGAYWCGECGQSLIAFTAAPPAGAAAAGAVARLRKGATRRSIRLSYSAVAGIGASLAASVLVLATISGSFGMAGTGVSPSGPSTPGVVAAARNSQSATTPGSTSNGVASASAPVSVSPLASGAHAAPTPPPTTAPTSVAATNAPTAAAPTPPASTPAPAGLALDIASLPAAVAATTTATVVATTSPGAMCKIKVKYHSGKSSTAPGLLKKKVADATGRVSWTWTVEAGTLPGNATATVTCSLKGKSATKDKVFVTT
jgi:ribosomal protein L40E